jgi:hypothetical protein
MGRYHIGEQWLQSALPQVPLQRPITNAHAIEIARQTAIAIRHARRSFKRAGQSQTALFECLIEYVTHARSVGREPKKSASRELCGQCITRQSPLNTKRLTRFDIYFTYL